MLDFYSQRDVLLRHGYGRGKRSCRLPLFIFLIFYCHNRGVLQWQSGTIKEAERNQRCSSGSRGQPVAFPTTFRTHPSFSFIFFFFSHLRLPRIPPDRRRLTNSRKQKHSFHPLNLDGDRMPLQLWEQMRRCHSGTRMKGWFGGGVG